LNKLLENRQTLNNHLNNNITTSNFHELRKKEMRYKNWHLNVYSPLQSEIIRNANSPLADTARNIRDLKYLQYLDRVNNFGCSFRDDFESKEYDPIGGLISLEVNMGKQFKDPTNLPQRKYQKEENTLLKCMYGAHEDETLSKDNQYLLEQIEKMHTPFIIHNSNENRKKIIWNDWLLEKYNYIQSDLRDKRQ
jgi:hypothetical protein